MAALAVIALLMAAWLAFTTMRSNPLGEEVVRLLRSLQPEAEFFDPHGAVTKELLAMGPKAYPQLGSLIKANDSRIGTAYDALRYRAPGFIQRILPVRQSKVELRLRAAFAVRQMGPAVSRALVPEICESLSKNLPGSQNDLMAALRWSIPESPRAVKALEEWLKKPDPAKRLYDEIEARDVWPSVPQFAPLLKEWLQVADQAHLAAFGLRWMGTNALAAVPSLLNVCREGVDGNARFTVTNAFPMMMFSRMHPMLINRAAALAALGNLGFDSKDVLDVLSESLSDPNPLVRMATADAIEKLGSKAVPLLPELLTQLERTNLVILEHQVEALGGMGSEARDAIPSLLRLVEADSTNHLFGQDLELPLSVRMSPPPPLPGGAALALYRIDPEKALPHVRLIADMLKSGHPRQFRISDSLVRELRPLADDLVPLLEPDLHAEGGWRRLGAVSRILLLKPDHALAQKTLLELQQSTTFILQQETLRQSLRIFGPTPELLEQLRKAPANSQDGSELGPMEEMGLPAKPLAPLVAHYLTNVQPSVRYSAGRVLRKIAPELMPISR